jgi:dTDP-glucose pyrophosphorylase
MSVAEGIWRQAILPPTATVQQAILNLNLVSIKIVLVANEADELQGTISDGDIRRGLLRGLDINSPVTDIIHRNPLVVPPEVGRETVMQLMLVNKIQQIPVVNERRQVVGLHLWDQITTTTTRTNLMVIMAGGLGKRLHPYTEECPKPMLPVAGKPMLERIIERARAEGFSRFVLAVRYLGHMIEDYFGNGDRWQVSIDYLREDTPLGTAGALSLLEPVPDQPFVVTNGDVLTDVRYGEVLDFHERHQALATMAVRQHEWQHPFGVVHTQGVDIVGFEEKPLHLTHVNAGIYALEPAALRALSRAKLCDMPTLFERLQAEGGRVIAYPMHEPWLDVGRPDDLERAQRSTQT